MLEQLFKRNLNHHRNAPLLKERVEYLNYLSINNATEFRLKLIEGYLLRATELLRLQDRRMVTVEEIEAAAVKWGKMKTTHHLKKNFSESGKKNFSMYTKSWLRYLNWLDVPVIEEGNEILQELYKTSSTLKRHQGHPLLRERISYLKYLQSQEKRTLELKLTASYLLRIIEFLHLENGRIITIKELIEAAQKWGLSKKYNTKTSSNQFGKKLFIKIGLDWLGFLNRVEATSEENDILLKKLFKLRHVLFHQIESPLLAERLLFLHYRKNQGIKDSTLYNEAMSLLVIMTHLKFYSVRTVKVSELTVMAGNWSRLDKIHPRTKNYTYKNKLSLIHTAKIWLSLLDCLEDDTVPSIPFTKKLSEYLYFQSRIKGLSERTIISKRGILKRYLKLISEHCVHFDQVTPDIIGKIISNRKKTGLSRRTIKNELSVLRSFLCFASEKRWCMNGLSESIRAPRIYEHELLPLAPTRENIQKMVSEFATETTINIRDFAILQLLTVYGLRSSEVAYLQLDDLDWQKEIIYVRRSKGCKPQLFPLTPTVGDAIIHYLKEARPNESSLREVFLTQIGPYKKLNNSSIYAIINKILKPMDWNIKSCGPHCLRHASATYLINTGFSLKEISDYLGHQKIDTTRIYSKVDLTNLYKVADINWEIL
ncbi:hypothetical protein CMU23_03400 [Elizabethkingia anophelis]|nr:hypothetical protein [Elizabethkingia anophelis]MDV3830872.1 hypothetical protein [Elizabethkingia anophelis]